MHQQPLVRHWGLSLCPSRSKQEFLCAINGHMMKQPARSPHGHVFELSTILLWLESRGRVCPFTGKPLSKGEHVLISVCLIKTLGVGASGYFASEGVVDRNDTAVTNNDFENTLARSGARGYVWNGVEPYKVYNSRRLSLERYYLRQT